MRLRHLVLAVIATALLAPTTASAVPGTGSITGQVTEVGPAPLNGITVQAWQGNVKVQEVSTDPMGNYTISGVTAGDYTVFFTDPTGYHADQWFDDATEQKNATTVTVPAGGTASGKNVTLAQAGHVKGTVTNTQSTPLVGACVTVWDVGQNSQLGAGTTDALGHYDIGGVIAGGAIVQFKGCAAGNYVSEWWNNKTSPGNADALMIDGGSDSTGINAALAPAGTISGTVSNTTPNPLQGICVSLSGGPTSGGQVSTDAMGHYTFSELAPGTYTVIAVDCLGTTYAPQSVDGKVVTAGQTTQVNITMQQGGHITGQVVNGTMTPLENICVSATRTDGPGDAYDVTDAMGNYDMGQLVAGTWDVTFQDCTGNSNWVTSQTVGVVVTFAHNTVVNKTMVDGGYVSGHVTGPGGTPDLENVCIELRTPAGDYVNSSNTDAGGNYTISHVPPGSYTVKFITNGCVQSGSYRGAETTGVTVTSGNTANADKELAAAATISGTVTGVDGPLVSPCIFATETGTGDQYGAGADGAGAYTLKNLDPGSYQIEFVDCQGTHATEWYDDANNPSAATLVQVIGSSTITGIDAVLAVGSTISGTVSGPHGGDGICVATYTADGSQLGEALTQLNGNYTVTRLPAGTYTMRFRDCNGSRYADQWFNNKRTQATGDTITIGAAANATGKNVTMSGSSAQGYPNPGESVSTGASATASNPVQLKFTAPNGGATTISVWPSATTPDSSSFDVFGSEFFIDGPDGTVGNPLVLEFTIDSSLLSGVDTSTVTVMRNGTPVANCSAGAAATTAVPDPCVKSRTDAGGGDLKITVLSSHSSLWNIARPVATTGGDGGGGGGGTDTTPTPTQTTPTTTTPTTTTPPVTTPAAAKCVVPKLIGLTLKKAKKALAKAHCGVGKITKKKAKSKKQKKGTVIAQKPAKGTKKPAGSKVAIVLAR